MKNKVSMETIVTNTIIEEDGIEESADAVELIATVVGRITSCSFSK